ncbi:MAG: hypothetical protein JNL42_02875, partial [Anaerolineae bacterium]|nr:hypothetical protein [Anaerolineae bacterium]
WLGSGQILTYTFQDGSREIADIWFEDVKSEIASWNAERRWLMLIDIRMGGRIISSAAFMRGRQLSHLRPELPGKTAIVVASSVAAHLTNGILRSLSTETRRQRRVFDNQERAVEWLLDTKR